ncbi:MAG: dethiobiotin synthase [Bacteroidota bacterium]
MNLFVTGIGTNVGKTIASAILTEALQADYWKPIQSGTIEGRDSDTVKSLISNSKTVIHPECYLLKEPLSPHFAAKLDGVEIELDKINIPVTDNHLIIEGAGGLLVPINSEHYVIDIARKTDCEIALVISNYLGCINHTLLSIDYLRRNNFKIHSLIFNGIFEKEVKEAVLKHALLDMIIDIPILETLTNTSISRISESIRL